MDFIVGILLEFIGQIIVEGLAELGLRSLGSATGLTKFRHPILSLIGYVLLALIFGGISLQIFEAHFIQDPVFRLVNLFLTPCLIGLMMGVLGKRLIEKDLRVIRLDSFAYGFLFAFVFALVRFLYAKN